MKVLHIQYSMPPAGNACYRLHIAMLRSGIDSSVLNIERSIAVRNNVYSKSFGASAIIKKFINKKQIQYIKKKLVPDAYFYSHKPIVGADLINETIVQEADVIYFHWVAGGCITFEEIERIAKTGKLIIFFMHDMWPFTGGCHHSFDCNGYESGCHKCPLFKNKCNIASKQIEAKKRIFSKYSNIIFISPSKWMAECARKSHAIKCNRVFSISNIIDEKIFRPINKNIARDLLDLPQDKKIITFGCQAGTNNPYKGWKYLKDAMSLLHRDDIHVVVYGVDYQKATQDQVSYPITFLGPIFDETKLALVCNATDVFVSPSLAESFGLTFLENILCGTPVVGFDNTAIGEIIKSGVNGYLAKNKDTLDLANGINTLLDNPKIIKCENYSSCYIVEQHIQLINTIISLV